MTKKIKTYNGSQTITNEEISALPLKAYAGPITVVDDKNLLPGIFKEIEKHELTGFDTETRPSFKKGQFYHVALLQIAIPKKVFIIRLQYTGFTKEIQEFLSNRTIHKAGVGVRDDIHALKKLGRFQEAGFIDLAPIAKDTGLKVESVKKLTALLLGFRISKSSQTSNWEVDKLTKKQIEYAATDAWVCLELYKKFKAVIP